MYIYNIYNVQYIYCLCTHKHTHAYKRKHLRGSRDGPSGPHQSPQ